MLLWLGTSMWGGHWVRICVWVRIMGMRAYMRFWAGVRGDEIA